MTQQIENQVTELLSGEGEQLFTFKLSGGEIPINIMHAANSTSLCVMFHTAIDRKSTNVPHYSPFLTQLKNVTQVSVSDPSLLVTDLSVSWYTGHDGFETQSLLVEILRSIVSKGNFQRTVFFGASSGGFAALYFSSFFPGSVAVVLQPQTDLIKYTGRNLDKYSLTLRPSLNTPEQWAEKACTNLSKVYLPSMGNSIVYIQSAGDYEHLRIHALPFLSNIANTQGWNVIVNFHYWGKLNHSPIPLSEFIPWLQASFLSSSTKADEILTTYHTLISSQKDPQTKQQLADSKDISSKDLNLSKLIHDYQMRQMER
jgi:hypothetical protein